VAKKIEHRLKVLTLVSTFFFSATPKTNKQIAALIKNNSGKILRKSINVRNPFSVKIG